MKLSIVPTMYYILFSVAVFFVGLPKQEIYGAWVNDEKISTYGLSSEELRKIEITINDFLNKFASPASHSDDINIASHRSSHLQENLASKIHMIADIICNEINSVLEKLGFNNKKKTKRIASSEEYINWNKYGSGGSIYYELFSFPHELIQFGRRVSTRLSQFSENNNYRQRGYAASNFILPKVHRNHESGYLKTFSEIDKSSHYLRNLGSCVDSRKFYFDLKKAAGKLIKYPPADLSEIVKNRLRQRVPRNSLRNQAPSTEFEAMICQALTEDPKKTFKNCLREFHRINNCVEGRLRKSVDSDDALLKSSKTMISQMKKLNVGCKETFSNGISSIECTNKENSSVLANLIKFVPKFPNYEGFISYFGNLAFNTEFGTNILHDIDSLAEVYERGIAKKNKLSKTLKGKTDSQGQYKKYLRTLDGYKSNLVKVAVQSSDNLREMTTTVEESFVNTTKKILNVDMSQNLVVMKCFGDFFNSIFGQFPSDKNNSQSVIFWNGDTKKKPTNELSRRSSDTLKNLIASVKKLQYQMQLTPRTSTIVMLANTFLLATMFYECIVFLAAAMFRSDGRGNVTWPQTTTQTPTPDFFEEFNDENNHSNDSELDQEYGENYD